MKLRTCALLLAISFFSSVVPAQQKEQGTIINEVQMYVSPDLNSQKLARATRGRDVPLVMERTKIGEQTWAHVLIMVDVNRDAETTRQITGWVPSNVVISTSTPNGDQIIFGEAVDSENQAEQRGGRRTLRKMPCGFTIAFTITGPTRRWRVKDCGAQPISAGNWKRPMCDCGLRRAR